MPAWVPCCSAPCAKCQRARERPWRRLGGLGIQGHRSPGWAFKGTGRVSSGHLAWIAMDKWLRTRQRGLGEDRRLPVLWLVFPDSLGRSKLLGKEAHCGDAQGCWAVLSMCPAWEASSGDTVGHGIVNAQSSFKCSSMWFKKEEEFPFTSQVFPWSPAHSAFWNVFLSCLFRLPWNQKEAFANFLTDFQLLNRDKYYNSRVKGHIYRHWGWGVGWSIQPPQGEVTFLGKVLWGASCGFCLRNNDYPASASKAPNLIAEQMDPGILQAEPSPEGPQDRAQPISKTIRPSEKWQSQTEYVSQEGIVFSLWGQDDRKCLYCLFLNSTKGEEILP